MFEWFAAGPVPAACDLRRVGWSLVDGREARCVPAPLLAMPGRPQLGEWVTLVGEAPARRRRVLVVGIDDSQQRAHLLRLGFGDAIGPQFGLDEVASRAIRVGEHADSLPRRRELGALELDLLARDAYVAGRAAGLHPREFALLWRLSDTPGEAVAPARLLREVWRMAFRPETNSLAVHVSRLRAKLRHSGLGALIETLPGGAYRLRGEEPPVPPAFPAAAGNLPLDAYVRLGKEQGIASPVREQDGSHAL